MALRRDIPQEAFRYDSAAAELVRQAVVDGALHRSSGRVKAFESRFAEHVAAMHALATTSGTCALHLALSVLGIGPGDEVVVPAYTFVAVAQAVLAQGAIPIFADIDRTGNLSPDALQRAVTERTRAVIVVHMFGSPARMNEIKSVAERHAIDVVEDCAQSLGARYEGRLVGTFGRVACFSFNIKKSIPLGEGGMLTTSDPAVAERVAEARNRGLESMGSDVVRPGFTFHMTELQAILGLCVLDRLEELNAVRRLNAELLLDLVRGLDLEHLHRPQVADPCWTRFVFLLPERIDRRLLLAKAEADGIPFRTFYPIPLYRYSLFERRLGIRGAGSYPFDQEGVPDYAELYCPVAEDVCERQLGMEFSPYLREEHIIALAEWLRTNL